MDVSELFFTFTAEELNTYVEVMELASTTKVEAVREGYLRTAQARLDQIDWHLKFWQVPLAESTPVDFEAP